MISEATLLADIRRFISRTGMTATDFGKAAVGNPALVTRLKQGRTVTIDTYNRAVAYMNLRRTVGGKTPPLRADGRARE